MHHHLFPSKDTYITNRTGYSGKNFGIDELLQIGTKNEYVRSRKTTQAFTYNGVSWSFYCVTDFDGNFQGTIDGNVVDSTGSITGSFVGSASFFDGNMTGSFNGYVNGVAEASTSYAGYLPSFSGSLSASAVVGTLSGSLIIDNALVYSGSLTGSSGHLTGVVYGTDTINYVHWVVETTKYADRSLLKFDLTAISNSIVRGEITNPAFKLKLKVCNEYDLPIKYAVYAFPVSQSWEMGNGYYSDGGSDTGTSWFYRDYYSGSLWYSPATSSVRPVVDFFNTASNATGSFGYGGGTWYYTDGVNNMLASQSFAYESSDISMDVTNIVMAWLSGSLANEGFIVMSGDEIVSTGSGFVLTFFGRDTNSINSPYLDIMWDDWEFVTGSQSTGSVNITSSFSGMTVTAQTGSTFSIEGGIQGTFSSSVFITTRMHFVTASAEAVDGYLLDLTGSMTGSIVTLTGSAFGSVTGSTAFTFTSSYWSGSIDGGAIYESNDAEISSSLVDGFISGSLVSASLSYYEGTITSSVATITATSFTGHYRDMTNNFVGGFIIGVGTGGNIIGLPIFGSIEGIMSISQSGFTGSCGAMWTAYLVTASFNSGVFSGSTFTSYYMDNKFEDSTITGAWNPAALYGATVSVPIPSGIDPYAYAYVLGTYVWGTALGTYQTTQSNGATGSAGYDSASFTGQFINGPLIGGYLDLQLSGSVTTSSYSYTSSVTMDATTLSELDIDRSFTVIVKDLRPQYKGGDIPRINVFGRKEFPLKTFEKASQQSDYIVPNYLPTSSYYAIKDNMSEEIIVDFDNYTRISCDANGNYFLLDTTGLAQERPYRVLIRVEDSSSKYTFDNGNVFKITR